MENDKNVTEKITPLECKAMNPQELDDFKKKWCDRYTGPYTTKVKPLPVL